MDSVSLLKKYFGYSQFREGQEEIIKQILAGRDVVGIMPTGAGKSVCYQIPSLQLEGMTLVVSPLISLMKDQVSGLLQSGVKVGLLNSSLTATEYNEVLRSVARQEYKILYVAPERLTVSAFLNLAVSLPISLVAVDEAHCVSQWGHNFRPSYLGIPDFIKNLKQRPVVSAFTATATSLVRDDIVSLLAMNDPYMLTTGFDRKNLFFSVKKPRDKMAELAGYLKKNSGKSGIVYCATRKKTDEICLELCDNGFQATRYHAGLSEQERRENQDDFIYDRKTVMVATNAFGMGIDKSNVNFVIHFNMPKNIESYYQEAGRAGRDGTAADCVLFYAAGDVHLNNFLLEKSVLDNDELSPEMKASIKENNAELLKRMTWYCSTTDCLRAYILEYFGEKSALYCGNCQNCKTSFETVNVTIDAQKIISCVFRLMQRGQSVGRVAIARILHGSKDEKILRQNFESLSTFGIMADAPLKKIYSVMDYLVWEGYLKSTGGDYPVLQLTPRYLEITKQKKNLLMKLPKLLQPTEKPEKVSSANSQGNYDDELFQRLRELRSRLAHRKGVPAFVVFSDATLRDMCRTRPTDNESFLAVSGVGTLKMEQYAIAFTEVIRTYLAEKSR